MLSSFYIYVAFSKEFRLQGKNPFRFRKYFIILKTQGMSTADVPFFHQKTLVLPNFSIQNLFKYDELVIFAA